MCFFNTKAFLISAIIITKIVYLNFLANYANRVALIMWISKVLNKLKSFLVSCADFYLTLGLILNIKLISNLGLGSLSIFFIIKY